MFVIRKSSVLFAYLLSCVVLSICQVDKPNIPDVFQVEVQGIFRYENAEMEGSLYYDRANNRAAVSFTYQGDTTKKIYRFNDNEVIAISGEVIFDIF
ncbi:hypothetical protein AVEN_19217-1 [Araneus ventricosus]|uniref:Uncharacterized protein n=1 Tax=Araneus ventricosus TaxID=182803 RepID=A0A4Y2S9K8_ARAVE|nr:hypothetical protein AVEN_19217-1 [Araneus ventricosus]